MKILEIPFQMPGLNDYIRAERTHRNKAANMKKQLQDDVAVCIKSQDIGKLKTPVNMVYIWVEKEKRRDKDNISSFGRKVIQDALVKEGAIENDGWSQIEGFMDVFKIDKEKPMIKVVIYENGEYNSDEIY